MPQKLWVVGEEVLAADFQTYVQNQVVPTFPNNAGRDTWASPPDGALCVTLDTNQLWQRIGGVWTRQGAGQQVGFAANPADTGIGTTLVSVLTAPFTALAGRRYWVHADLQFGVSSGSGAVFLEVRVDGAQLIGRNTSWGLGGATAGPTMTIGGVLNPMTAGAHTVDLQVSSTVAAGLFYQDGYLTVIDVGI